MGYSEAYCHLCGVSFNIARRRKPGESDLGSWDNCGEQSDQPDVEEPAFDDLDLEECARNGCLAAIKYTKDEKAKDEKEEGDDGEDVTDSVLEDPDYSPTDEDAPSMSEEYDSDYESADSMSISEEDNTSNSSSSTDEKNDPEIWYSDWVAQTWIPHASLSGEPIERFGNLLNKRDKEERVIPIRPDMLLEDYDPEQLVHIPSRTCEQVNAYSGFRISLEEIRGCRTSQFLVHKSAMKGDLRHVNYLEDWEATEDWFLSGLSDGMADREGNPSVWPAQGGVEEPSADNVDFDPRYTTPAIFGMPLHPWCLDIFRRQSQVRFDRVNISGLIKWRDAESSYEDFHSFPRSPDVLEGQEQYWRHVPGKEYLAANPLYIPGLPSILLNATRDEEKVSFDTKDETPGFDRKYASAQVGGDVFTSMPPEICLLLSKFLDASDLNNLRAASRAFTRLPNSVWRRLVREEMPWLWESWYDEEKAHIPSFWTTVMPNSLRLLKEERERYLKQLSDIYKRPDEAVDFLLPFSNDIPDQVKLSKADTNWHEVYTQIKKNWNKLKGLQNRKRIWKDVEEIMRRIEKYENEI